MIKRAKFHNYRSLRKVQLDLGPLTVLVGPNGSGKSSLMRGLCAELAMTEGDAWQRTTLKAQIDLEFLDGTNFRRFLGPASVVTSDGRPHASQLLHLDLNQMRRPNKAEVALQLATDGGNLTNAFDALTRGEQSALAKQFCELVPTFSDVDVGSHSSGMRLLRFQDRWARGMWYQPFDVSDGTMLVLAYLVLQYQRAKVDMILVEEPERGLHPYLLGELVRFLRGMAEGKVGPRAIQVVLATHSADLLDHLQPEEVRMLTRDPADGSVRVDTISPSEPGWQEAYRNYDESLGALWKSGGLRGVPGGG